MPITINVKCTLYNGLQTDFIKLNGSQPHNNVGETSVEIETWLKLKSSLKNLIENGSVSVDSKDEKITIESYKSQCFAEFERDGVPAVRSFVSTGKYPSETILPFAIEWLEWKSELRDAETLSIAKEANAIAREARSAAFEQARWAKWAAIAAVIAAIIAIIWHK